MSILTNCRVSALYLLLILIASSTILSGCSKKLSGLEVAANDDDYEIYNFILDNYSGTQKYVFYVESTTTLRDLKEFDFKDPKNHLLDTVTEKRIYQPQWKAFLDHVNLDDAPIKKLILSKLQGKYFRVYSTKKFKTRHRLRDPNFEISTSAIRFSPIIVSDDKTKAVFIVISYSNPEAASANIFFFERINSGWEEIDSIMLWIA